MSDSVQLTRRNNHESNPCFSTFARSAVIVILTGIALAAIAACTVGLLGKFEIVAGLNSMSQWMLIGAGACLAPVTLAIGVACYSCFKSSTKELPDLTFEMLETELKAIIEDENPEAAIHRLAKSIPVERLQELLQQKSSDAPNALEIARKRLEQARSYIEIKDASPSLRVKLMALSDALIAVVDSVFAAFGIADFFEIAESPLQAEFKLQRIVMLISFFTLLTATLLPMLGVANSASIVGGSLVLLAALSVVWPHIRPLPSRILEGENWSKQMREGKLEVMGGRKEAIKKIATALVKGQHPLLIGQSGVGKTQTVKAFVQALERGEYPALQGKTVFYFNTAKLVDCKEMFSGGNKILKRISDAIGDNPKKREDCILVLDEIHLAFQKKEDSSIGEQLKTYLDQKDGNFPHVIGLTTQEEYNDYIYVPHQAVDRRFEKIIITSTDEATTKTILKQFLMHKAPGTVVDKDALKLLIRETEEHPQPLTSQVILGMVLEDSKSVGGIEEGSTTQSEKPLADLGSESREDSLGAISRNKRNLAWVREALFRTILQIGHWEQDRLSPKDKVALSEVLLLKCLEKMLKAEALNVKAVIEKELIDRALTEDKANRIKRAEGQARARRQALERRHNLNQTVIEEEA